MHRPVSERPSTPARPGGEFFLRPAPGAPPVRGTARLPGRGPARPPRRPPGSATPPPRCSRRCGTSAPGRGSSSSPASPAQDRTGQGRRPPPDPGAARGRALHRRDRRRAGRRGHPAEPDRDRRGDRRRGAAPAVAPPRRRARRRGPGDPGPRRGGRLRRPARTRRDPAGRAAAGHPGPDRPGRPGPGGRGGLPLHAGDPGPVLCAVAAGAQADQHPACLPRLRHRRRPRRRAVRRADRAAQGHRADHLLLPARALPPGSVPGRAGQGRPRRRAGHRRGAEPGLPRRHALGRGPGAGEALRAPPLPAHPLRCSPSSPKTPLPTPCSTPTPTWPRPARTAKSSPSPTTGTGHRARPGAADLRLQAHHPGRPRRTG